jgi:hypothetical protein
MIISKKYEQANVMPEYARKPQVVSSTGGCQYSRHAYHWY